MEVLMMGVLIDEEDEEDDIEGFERQRWRLCVPLKVTGDDR
jgi:hypothetical protein